jgi:subtilisin family serine protease
VKRRLSLIAAGTCIFALSACGGGGSGGGSSVTPPHPSPTPTGQPSLSCQGGIPIDATQRQPLSRLRRTQSVTLSQYTFNSNPSTLAVTINKANVGKTVLSTTPAFANLPYLGTISGPAASFSVCYSQLMDGNHTVFYNTKSDTNGHIGTITSASTLSSARQEGVTNVLRRGPSVRNETGVDSLRIQVHFITSAIHANADAAASIERSEGVTRAYTLGRIGNTMNRILFIPRGQTPDSLAAKFRRHSEVADARPLPLRYTQSASNDPCLLAPCYGFDIFQWDFTQIDTPDAWGITQGSAPIAIIDTGADLTAHDLSTNVKYEVKWVASEPPYPNIAPGAAQDQDGHGSNVSGIADAVTNNAYGFAGVGWNAPLLILRIFPTPKAPDYSNASNYGASTADEAKAVEDAVAHGAKVINLSLGSCPGQSGGPDPTEFEAIESALAQGVTVVAAAGNERAGGSSCGTANSIDFPAAYPGVIAVGATSLIGSSQATATEHVASYSNSGPGLAVVAPGGDPTGSSDPNPLHWIANLYSTTVADPKQRCQTIPITPPLCGALFAGTSQATPHVTGTVALMRSIRPALGPAQTKAILESTTDNLNDPNQGFGRINAFRAVAAAAGITSGAPSPNPLNFRAIAYTVTHGSNRPNVLNVTFPAGVPVQSDGTFRVADVPPGSPAFRIGLWNDANGDGIVNAGDYFGSAGPCNASAPCGAAATIDVSLVTPGFVLK